MKGSVLKRLAGLAILSLGGAAQADMFVLPPPEVDLVGLEQNTVARFEDTLPDIARNYGLGYEEILAANPGADPWLPGDGREVRQQHETREARLPGRPNRERERCHR